MFRWSKLVVALFVLILIGIGLFLYRPTIDLRERIISFDECKDVKNSLPNGVIQKSMSFQDFGLKVKISYYIVGEGDKVPILFINGGPGQDALPSIEYFLEQPNFFRDRKVFFFDQRGNGCSMPYIKEFHNSEVFNSNAIASDIARIIRKEGLKKVHLVGHSFGANVLYQFLKTGSGKVASSHSIGFYPQSSKLRLKSSCRNFSASLSKFFSKYKLDARFFRSLEKTVGKTCYRGHTITYCGLKFDGIYLLDVIEFGSEQMQGMLAKDLKALSSKKLDWQNFLLKWVFYDEVSDYWISQVSTTGIDEKEFCNLCKGYDYSFPKSLFSSCHLINRIIDKAPKRKNKVGLNLRQYFDVIGQRKNYFYYSPNDPYFPTQLDTRVYGMPFFVQTDVNHENFLESRELADFFKSND